MNNTLETIQKSIEINASRERVWDVLLGDQQTRRWYASFAEGLHAITDWSVGGKVLCVDGSGNGMVSRVLVNTPGEELSMEMMGSVEGGVEKYDGEDAAWTNGGREIYRLTETDGRTLLSIECDMMPGYVEMMSGAWDAALEKIREIAETA